MKLVGLSPNAYSTCQVVVRPMVVSSDWNKKRSTRFVFPDVLLISNRNAEPGSKPVALVCFTPSARLADEFCAVASVVDVSPLALAKFLNTDAVLFHATVVAPKFASVPADVEVDEILTWTPVGKPAARS